MLNNLSSLSDYWRYMYKHSWFSTMRRAVSVRRLSFLCSVTDRPQVRGLIVRGREVSQGQIMCYCLL